MKHFMTSLFVLLTLSNGFASCSTDEPGLPPQREQPPIPEIPDEPNDDNNNPDNPMSNHLKIIIGNTSFNVTLEENATAKAFKAKLPMTINMSELNGNEKFFNLPASLPTASANPRTVQAGDLMLYGSTTLVLFYKTFPTSYSYTRIGRVNNTTGLVSALGSGSIQVKFE